MNIIFVGLGATGSHAVLASRNVEGQITLVDLDKVEQKNSLSQFHSRMGLRRNKALAMQQCLLGMWGVKVNIVPHKVTDDNVAVILGKADLVLDCTDNIAARVCLMKFCRANDVPLLHAAMAQDGSLAQVTWTEDFTPDVESGDGATCENGENLPFHIIVGGVIAQTVKVFLTKGQKRNFMVAPSGVTRF